MSVYIHMYIYICADIYPYIYIHINVDIYIYVYINNSLSISIYMYVSIYVPIYLSIHPSIHLCIHLHTYVYTENTYMSKFPSIKVSGRPRPASTQTGIDQTSRQRGLRQEAYIRARAAKRAMGLHYPVCSMRPYGLYWVYTNSRLGVHVKGPENGL